MRRDVGLPARLLVIGLPLSVIAGSLLAAWLFDDMSWALAGFVGATLAPTDAALSAQVINDGRIPMRVRRVLNVESGLNDGIVTPVVAFTLAVAAAALGAVAHGTRPEAERSDSSSPWAWASAWRRARHRRLMVTIGSRRHWIIVGGRRLGDARSGARQLRRVAVAVGRQRLHRGLRRRDRLRGGSWTSRSSTSSEVVELPELLGEVMALVVWFLFGAVLVPVAVRTTSTRQMLVYAVLSLTVVRLAPVALALVGSGQDRGTVLFVGWFGPRGLASVVFALLAVEELGETPVVDLAVGAVALTVLLSVVLHGVSAGPLGARYVQLEAAAEDALIEPPRSRRAGRQHGSVA